MIYLDNNATTKIDPKVLEAMMPYLTDNFANASSTHQFGVGANEAVKKARQQVANLISASPKEIIFTSGATESINLGLKGIAFTNIRRGNHIITCKTEHKATLDTCKYLENVGFEVTYLPVQHDGLIDIEELKANIRPETSLITIMWVNNETGVIQSIDEISKLAHENGALFLTDATQAVGKIPINVYELEIDLLTFSSHKFYGPKGIGGLYIKNGIKFEPQIHGGGHEFGFRSGTNNVPSIIGMGMACEIALNEMEKKSSTIQINRDYLESQILNIKGTLVNGNVENRLYNVTNISFPNTDANVLIGQLKNIALSNGSACTAAIVEPSHVLKAMGLTDEQALGAIRFSLSKYNTKEELDITIKEIRKFINTI